MDILGGLTILGGLFSDNKKQKEEKISKINKKHPRNERSVYNSNNIERTRNITNKVASERYKQSEMTEKSGIVPQFYNRKREGKREIIEGFNSESEFSENSCENKREGSSSNISVDNNPEYFLKKEKKMKNNNEYENNIIKEGKENYKSQFEELKWDNLGEPVSSNKVHNSTNNIERLETERGLALRGGYSNYEENEMTYGIGEEGMKHNNMTPYFKSKDCGSNPMREGNLHKMNQRTMELFTGSRTNEIYNKTESNPLFGPLIGATNLYGTPVTTDFLETRYMTSQNRNKEVPFRQEKITPGLNLGYKEVSKQGYGEQYRILPKTTNELRTADNPKINYKGKINHGMKGNQRPIEGKMTKKLANKYKEYGEERLVKSLGYIRAPTISGEINKGNLSTVNRGLLEEIHYGPAKQDTDKITTDEMRGKYKISNRSNYKEAEPRNINYIDQNKFRGESDIYIPRITKRGQDNDYIGGIGTLTNKGYIYNSKDIPDITKREIYGKTERIGKTITGITKGYIYDPKDIPEMTRREINNKLGRTGGGAKGEIEQGYIINYKEMTPEQTNREIYSKLDRTKGGVSKETSKGYTINYTNMTPEMTNREIYSKLDRTKGGVKSEINKGYTINYENMTPDITMREIHGKRTYTNPLHNNKGNKNRHDVNNMIMNNVKEEIGKGRKPTNSNYTKGVMIDNTIVSLREPIQINRKLIPNVIETNNKLPFINTKMPILQTIENDQVNSNIKAILEGNPYINNIVHKSI